MSNMGQTTRWIKLQVFRVGENIIIWKLVNQNKGSPSEKNHFFRIIWNLFHKLMCLSPLQISSNLTFHFGIMTPFNVSKHVVHKAIHSVLGHNTVHVCKLTCGTKDAKTVRLPHCISRFSDVRNTLVWFLKYFFLYCQPFWCLRNKRNPAIEAEPLSSI